MFDTLLLRDTTPEPVRFNEISQLQVNELNHKFGLNLSALDLYWLRLHAARTVYATRTKRAGGREANWPEIFTLIFNSLGIPARDEWLSLCADIEMQYELKRLAPNRPLLESLKKAQAEGKPVFGLSDMYLSGSQIQFLVDRILGAGHGIKIYSSGDYGYGKGCGELFRHLARDVGVELSEVLHCGDNWYADYAKPRALGMHAMYLPRPALWKLTRNVRSLWFHRRFPAL